MFFIKSSFNIFPAFHLLYQDNNYSCEGISVNLLKMIILDILSSAMCRKMLDCKTYTKGYENTQTK